MKLILVALLALAAGAAAKKDKAMIEKKTDLAIEGGPGGQLHVSSIYSYLLSIVLSSNLLF